MEQQRLDASAIGAVCVVIVLWFFPWTSVAQVPELPPSTPTPVPSPEPEDDIERETAADGEEPSDGETAEPAKPIVDEEELEARREEMLNPYPEHAKLPAKEKWRRFLDGARGLLVWDFFDGRVTVRAHARVQLDGTVTRANDSLEESFGSLGNGVDFRRLQVFAQGTIDHNLRYSLSFGFGPDTGLGDAFVEGREHGLNVFGYRVGQFRLGFFQEPFSFERVMSSYYTGFVERSLPVWAFTPGNNLGYMVFDTTKNQRLSWAVGFFSFGQSNEENASNSVLSLTSRVTVLPVFRDDGRKLLHFGASFSTRDPQGSATRYRSRPEARFVDFLVDTGDFNSGRIRLFGVEAVGLNGPFSVQSELILSHVTGTEFGDLDFWGGYVQVGWFLTREHHGYDTEIGTFSRVRPKDEYHGLFTRRPGGAVELVGRISNVDLDDGGLSGGKMVNLSLGVNWYLSATSAVKFNYIHSDVKEVGRANILVLRYQFRPLPVPGWK
jgi:phosphate-selective porin OprO/OprP